MKRVKCVFLAVAVLGMLCLIAGCKKDVQFHTAFPLDEETITAALEKSGLPGEISESETTSYGEGHIQHVVRSSAETYSDTISPEEARQHPSSRVMTAGIDSIVTDGERRISIIFDQLEVSDQFAWDDWKNQIVFATLLYGGFGNEEEVYEVFLGKEPQQIENTEGGNSFQLDAQLSGGYCRAHYSSRRVHTLFNEYGDPAGKRHSGTLVVKIYESHVLYEKIRQEQIAAKEKADAARSMAQSRSKKTRKPSQFRGGFLSCGSVLTKMQGP